jgi:hypothetical protein
MQIKKTYKIVVTSLLILPNIFVVIMGVESFPYTCAPMFGHYINNNTSLYLFKFEGETNDNKIDLIDYLGKPESQFMRHFFSKVYGSTSPISPFTNKLSESETQFYQRMNMFFKHYDAFLKSNYNINLDRINIKVVKTNQQREPLSEAECIGYYDCSKKVYISNSINNTN